MKDLEKYISPLVEYQFPAFYKEEGENFIAFVKAYYEWLETEGNALYHSRRLMNYKDIDETLDDFIIHFKEKYLSNIQFTTASNKKLLIKKSQDLYRSKGTERAIDLFFKLVYGVSSRVYVPGTDLFKPSDGKWSKPIYLEVTHEKRNIDYVGKQVRGVASGSTAFVDKLVRRRIKGKYIDIFYVSAINGDFVTNEILLVDDVYDGAPIMVGSFTEFELIDKSYGYEVGDIVDIVSVDSGGYGKGRVTSIANATGAVDFKLIDGGFAYRTGSSVIISEKVLSLSNVKLPNTAILIVNNASGVFKMGELVNQSNGSANTANGYIIDIDVDDGLGSGTLTLTKVKGQFVNTAGVYLNVSGANSGAQANILNTNTSFFFKTYPFKEFETIQQPIANVKIQSVITLNLFSNDIAFSTGEVIYQTTGGTNTVYGTIVTQNSSIITVKYANTGEFTTALTIKGATSGANGRINGVTSKMNLPTGGETVTSYYSNGVISGQGVLIQRYSNSTPYISMYKVALSNGNLYDSTNTNYSEYIYVSNTSSLNAVIVTANTYANVTATGNVIGQSNTITLYLSDYSSRFRLGERVEQASLANGTITDIQPDGANVYLTLSNVIGVFEVGNTLYGTSTNAAANIQNFSMQIGVYDIANTFTNTALHWIVGSNSGTTANVVTISQGVGASFDVTSLDNEEQIVIGTDLIGGYNNAGVQYSTLNINALYYGLPKLPSGNLTNGTLLQQLTYLTANIGSVSLIGNINPGSDYNVDPFVLIYDEYLAPFNRKDLEIIFEKKTFNTFLKDEIVTQSITLPDAAVLTVSGVTGNFQIGELVNQSNGSANTANGYITAAEIVLGGGTITLRNVKGTFVNTGGIYSTANGFTTGVEGTIDNVQTIDLTSVAKGVVKSANLTHMIVKPITFNTTFIEAGSINGTGSGANGIIQNIRVIKESRSAGMNADVSANVVTANGVVTGLARFDSGYGYTEDQIVEFQGPGKLVGTGRIKLGKQGISEGYYSSTDGFLSYDKYLHDGTYYQEYSYEIISKIPFQKYADVYRTVLHTAGTLVFGAVELDTEVPLVLESPTLADQVLNFRVSGLSNTEFFANNETVYQSNGTANVATGKIIVNQQTELLLSNSANVNYQLNTTIYQPNSVVNAASGVISGKIANAEANTLTLYLTGVKGTFVNTANVHGTTNTVITIAPYIEATLRNILDADPQTGSFTVGETVRTSGGFVGVVQNANEYEAEIVVTTGAISVGQTLVGDTSTAKADILFSTGTTAVVGQNVSQYVTHLSVYQTNGTFTNGEVLYSKVRNTLSGNLTTQIFKTTMSGIIESSNSTNIILSDTFGELMKGITVYGKNSGAQAIVSRYYTEERAKGKVIAANSSSITLTDTVDVFSAGRHLYGANIAANAVSISYDTKITPSSNVSSAINTILVSNTTGKFDISYSLVGANNGATASITYVENYND